MEPHSNQGLDRLIKPTRLAVDLDGHVTLRPGPVRWHSAAGTRHSLGIEDERPSGPRQRGYCDVCPKRCVFVCWPRAAIVAVAAITLTGAGGGVRGIGASR